MTTKGNKTIKRSVTITRNQDVYLRKVAGNRAISVSALLRMIVEDQRTGRSQIIWEK